AVYTPSDAPGFWDLARDHYGSHTPMVPCRSTPQVIRAVTENKEAIGVLPMPQEGDSDPDPWWRHLLSSDGNAPHVIARLPFGARGNARKFQDTPRRTKRRPARSGPLETGGQMPRKRVARLNQSLTTKLGRSADENAGCAKKPNCT